MATEARDQYELDEATARRIYREDIREDLFQNAKPASSPAFVLLGGQPGAGKTASQRAIESGFAGKEGIVAIIGDDFRRFHPLNNELMARDDKTAAIYTGPDSGRWVRMAAEDARAGHYNVLMETTLRQPAVATSTMQAFKEAGYRTELRVLAVPWELSEQGIQARYELQKMDRGIGRMTPAESHRVAFENLPTSVRAVEEGKLADRILVVRRDGSPIYENHLNNGQWARSPRAAEFVAWERGRPWAADELARYAAGNGVIRDFMHRPERLATIAEMEMFDQRAHEGEKGIAARSAAGPDFARAEAARLLGEGVAIEAARADATYYGRIVGETPTHWIQDFPSTHGTVAVLHEKRNVEGVELGQSGALHYSGEHAAMRERREHDAGVTAELSRDGRLLDQKEHEALEAAHGHRKPEHHHDSKEIDERGIGSR